MKISNQQKLYGLSLLVGIFTFSGFFILGSSNVSNLTTPNNASESSQRVFETTNETPIATLDIDSSNLNPTVAKATLSQAEPPRLNNEKDIAELLPNLDTVRKEVGTNPHGSPNSYIVFASKVANLKDQALYKQDQKHLLIELLTTCNSNNQTPISVKAFCAEELALLAQKRKGDYAKAWKMVQANLNAKVKSLVISDL